MQDKVGSNVPTAEQVSSLVAEIQSISEKVAAFTVMLTPPERSATTKMRTGGESVVADIGALATHHALTLPQISVDGMNADLALAQRLRPLANAVEQLSQRLDDTVLEAQSECWWAATAYYTALCRIAGADSSLKAALKPLVDFFATGRRKKPPTAA